MASDSTGNVLWNMRRPNNKISISKSDLNFDLKRRCGLSISQKPLKNLIKALENQKNGIANDNSILTESDRVRISNCHLPLKTDIVYRNLSKAFCSIYSKDGNRCLTASQDRVIRLYDTSRQMSPISSMYCPEVDWSILDVCFTHDMLGTYYSTWSKHVHEMRFKEEPPYFDHQALPPVPGGSRFAIFSIALTSDGTNLLCAANNKNVYIYDLGTGTVTSEVIQCHSDDVNVVRTTDTSPYILFTGGDDGFCKVWDKRIATDSSESVSKPVGMFAGHRDGITYVDISEDGRYVITNSKDQSIKLWDMRAFSGETGEKNVKFSVSRQRWDYRWQPAPYETIRSSNFEGDTSLLTFKGHSVLQTLVRCKFSPLNYTGQRFISTGCSSGRVIIYDILNTGNFHALEGHEDVVRDISWHPQRLEMITASWDSGVRHWTNYGAKPNHDDDPEERRKRLRRRRNQAVNLPPEC